MLSQRIGLFTFAFIIFNNVTSVLSGNINVLNNVALRENPQFLNDHLQIRNANSNSEISGKKNAESSSIYRNSRKIIECVLNYDGSCILDELEKLVKRANRNLLREADEETASARKKKPESAPSELFSTITQLVYDVPELLRESISGFIKSGGSFNILTGEFFDEEDEKVKNDEENTTKGDVDDNEEDSEKNENEKDEQQDDEKNDEKDNEKDDEKENEKDDEKENEKDDDDDDDDDEQYDDDDDDDDDDEKDENEDDEKNKDTTENNDTQTYDPINISEPQFRKIQKNCSKHKRNSCTPKLKKRGRSSDDLDLDIGDARGKKKKKKKAIIKLLVIMAIIKAKISMLLKLIATKLQFKFLLIAAANLLINLARFWWDLKKGHDHPQKVIYYEHAQHQHHYDGHDDWHNGWGRSFDEKVNTLPNSQELAYAKQKPFENKNRF